ncbi:unnamed protein product, partial [Polarella glacialis]
VDMCLSSIASFKELADHNIVSTMFAAAKWDVVMQLHTEWASLRNVLCVPDHAHDNLVREYFGEKVAFFFHWMAVYTRYLGILAIAGFLLGVIPHWFFGHSDRIKRIGQLSFCLVLIIWATSFNVIYQRASLRLQQKWGMKRLSISEKNLPSYDPDKDGMGRREQLIRRLPSLCVMVYMLLFMGFVVWLNSYPTLKKNPSLHAGVISIVVKGGSFLWGKICDVLVSLENHRTYSRASSSRVWKLSSVKLFVSVWPFLQAAFLQEYMSATCGQNLSEVAHEVYHSRGWPAGTNVSIPANRADLFISPYELGFLMHSSFADSESGQVCISGCYPVECYPKQGVVDPKQCKSVCWEFLQVSATTLFLLNVLSTVVFVVIPILLTKMTVQREMAKAARSDDESSEETGPGDNNNNKDSYSFLQFQAKCNLMAPYAYGEWGGSGTEDFMEMAISFTMVTSFSVIRPSMAIIAFIAHIVEYRLLAFRMVNVTCRPFPFPSEGIGVWQTLMSNITWMGVTTTVGVAVFTMHPSKFWPFWQRLLLFIVAEKSLDMVKMLIEFNLPVEPHDVILVDDFNSGFCRKLRLGLDQSHQEQLHDYAAVNIGIHHRSE